MTKKEEIKQKLKNLHKNWLAASLGGMICFGVLRKKKDMLVKSTKK